MTTSTGTATSIDRTPEWRALAAHHRPPSGANRPSQLLISEVMNAYLHEHAPTKVSKAFIGTPRMLLMPSRRTASSTAGS